MNDLFTRVRPLIGEALDACQVAVTGSPAAGVLVEYLVACGVRRWLALAGNGWMGALLDRLGKWYGDEIDINFQVVNTVGEIDGVNLVLVMDDEEMAGQLAITLTRLAIFTPTGNQPSRALLALHGESFDLQDTEVGAVHHLLQDKGGTSERYDTGVIPYKLESTSPTQAGWDWQTAAPLMALLARALLLRGTPYAMATWEAAWAKGQRAYLVGAPDDPTQAAWQLEFTGAGDESQIYRTPSLRQGTLMIAGLGSLGSVAAHQLAPYVERLVLVDPDHMEMANLVRQSYSHNQLGQPKAMALAEALSEAEPGLHCEAVVAALTDDEQVSDLIARFGVTAALVTTGTHADFAISRALRAAAIPHVVGRCYARARFWEGIVVEGDAGPSYEQVRRQVAAGPTPAPTAEEVAAYGAVGELAAEPATAMESGWAAMWLARLTAQLMAPATLREGWFLARLAAGATCFIGGVVVELGVEPNGGGAAYGVTVPGEVHAWSAAEIG